MTPPARSNPVPVWPLGAAVALGAGLCLCGPALAQSESFLLERGGNVGPETRIKSTNCVTAPDGAVTCDTVIENPPGDTPAKPKVQLFSN